MADPVPKNSEQEIQNLPIEARRIYYRFKGANKQEWFRSQITVLYSKYQSEFDPEHTWIGMRKFNDSCIIRIIRDQDEEPSVDVDLKLSLWLSEHIRRLEQIAFHNDGLSFNEKYLMDYHDEGATTEESRLIARTESIHNLLHPNNFKDEHKYEQYSFEVNEMIKKAQTQADREKGGAKKYILWHILIGSSFSGYSHEKLDFPTDLSVAAFFERMYEKYSADLINADITHSSS